jgi:hypothetical protein
MRRTPRPFQTLSPEWDGTGARPRGEALKLDDAAAAVDPFYADPVFDAAHDAEFVWHEGEQWTETHGPQLQGSCDWQQSCVSPAQQVGIKVVPGA